MISRNTHNLLWKTLLILTLFSSPSLQALNELNARQQIGLNLLPGIIAANMRFNSEQDDKKESIKIYITFKENEKQAIHLSSRMHSIDKIRGHPVLIEAVSIDRLLNASVDRYSVVFISEPLNEAREALIEFSKQQQIMLFSPFKGDVEHGVMSGFEVTNKVLPAVNLTALKEANIRLKAFFLRIAAKHD